MTFTISGGMSYSGGELNASTTNDLSVTLPQPGNVLFHIDASVASSVTLTGSRIDQIDDQSGNGRNFTGVNAKPVYNLADQNGLNTFSTDTSTTGSQANYLTLTDTLDVRHAFVVARYSTANFVDFDGLFTTGSGNNVLIFTGNLNSATWFTSGLDLANYYENLVSTPGGATTTLTSWTVHSISNATAVSGTEWIIGHDREFMSRNWEGSIAEVVAYDIALSSTDRDNLITDLKTKWAIT